MITKSQSRSRFLSTPFKISNLTHESVPPNTIPLHFIIRVRGDKHIFAHTTHVVSYMGQRRGANFFLQGRDFLEGTGDEGSASVGNCLASAFAESGAADFEPVHLELPIAASSHGHVGEVAFVARWVRSSEDDLACL